jgi:hypothetical protein
MRPATIAFCLLLALPAFAAKPALVGTWKLVGVTTSQGPVPKEKLAGGSLTWQLAAGGALAITVTAGEQTKTSHGTWSVSGDQLFVQETGAAPQTMTWRILAGHLKLTGSDGKVTLELARQGR